LLLVVAAVCLCNGAPAPTPAAPGATTATSSKSSSPFSLFTKGLPQEKRKSFMELMKKLRASKQSTGSKDDKKKVTMTIDADIHKLLGEDYKKYRLITEKIKTMHASKKAETHAPPPPPPPLPAVAAKKKKKKAGP